MFNTNETVHLLIIIGIKKDIYHKILHLTSDVDINTWVNMYNYSRIPRYLDIRTSEVDINTWVNMYNYHKMNINNVKK